MKMQLGNIARTDSHKPVHAYRRKGLDYFCTCTEDRYNELAQKTNTFEVTIFYTEPQPCPKCAELNLTINNLKERLNIEFGKSNSTLVDDYIALGSKSKRQGERVAELELTLSHLELRMARVYMEVTGGKCSKDTPASSVISLYGEHLNERIKSAIDLETKPLVERVQQFDDHITTVANYLGAVCGGVDVGTNVPGSTAFEIIKKIKELEK